MSTKKEKTPELESIIAEMEELEHRIIATKGREYTQGSKDRAKNFKGVAEDLGISIYYPWYCYAKKHWDSILSFVKTGRVFSDELIERRVVDLVNYLHLLVYIVRQGGKK